MSRQYGGDSYGGGGGEFTTPRESSYAGEVDDLYRTPSSRDASTSGARRRQKMPSRSNWGEAGAAGERGGGGGGRGEPNYDEAPESARSFASQYYTDSSAAEFQSGSEADSDDESQGELNTARDHHHVVGGGEGSSAGGAAEGLSDGFNGMRLGAAASGEGGGGGGRAGARHLSAGMVGGGGGSGGGSVFSGGGGRGGGNIGGGGGGGGGGGDGGSGGGDFSEDEVREAFGAFDEDGDGLLDVHDVQSFFEVLGESLTVYEVSELIRMVDGDGDGKVNFDEFFDLATRSAQFFETR